MMTNSTENPKTNLFHRWIALLGIIPPHYQIMGNNNNSIFQRFYKLYVGLCILFIILAAITTQFYHFHLLQSEFPNLTLLVTESAQDITATICNIVTILAPTFFYSSSLDTLLANYSHICKSSFLEEILKITSSKRFAIQVTVSHVILLMIVVYDAYVWIMGFGEAQYGAFIFRRVQIYHNFVTILTIYVFVKFIKTQLECTNHLLTEKLESRGIKGKKVNSTIEVLTVFDDDQICSEIRQISQFYEIHVEQIALFNKLFGCQLLFLTLSFVMGLINSINLMILLSFSNYEVDLRDHLILTHLFWTLWQLVIGGLAVVMCTETEEVGRTTGDISLNALTNLPYSSENAKLKNELVLLNRLVNQKSPTFSAAGFFSINYSLLLSIIGSITSYVIVLIQFNKV